MEAYKEFAGWINSEAFNYSEHILHMLNSAEQVLECTDQLFDQILTFLPKLEFAKIIINEYGNVIEQYTAPNIFLVKANFNDSSVSTKDLLAKFKKKVEYTEEGTLAEINAKFIPIYFDKLNHYVLTYVVFEEKCIYLYDSDVDLQEDNEHDYCNTIGKVREFVAKITGQSTKFEVKNEYEF